MQDDSIHLCGFVYSGMKEPYIVYSRTPSCCCCRQPAGRQIQADPSGFYTSLSASCGFLLENQISPIEGRENVIVGDTSAPVFLSIFFYPLYVFLFFFQPFLSFFFFRALAGPPLDADTHTLYSANGQRVRDDGGRDD
jgi:hypothetical protein